MIIWFSQPMTGEKRGYTIPRSAFMNRMSPHVYRYNMERCWPFFRVTLTQRSDLQVSECSSFARRSTGRWELLDWMEFWWISTGWNWRMVGLDGLDGFYWIGWNFGLVGNFGVSGNTDAFGCFHFWFLYVFVVSNSKLQIEEFLFVGMRLSPLLFVGKH